MGSLQEDKNIYRITSVKHGHGCRREWRPEFEPFKTMRPEGSEPLKKSQCPEGSDPHREDQCLEGSEFQAKRLRSAGVGGQNQAGQIEIKEEKSIGRAPRAYQPLRAASSLYCYHQGMAGEAAW